MQVLISLMSFHSRSLLKLVVFVTTQSALKHVILASGQMAFLAVDSKRMAVLGLHSKRMAVLGADRIRRVEVPKGGGG